MFRRLILLTTMVLSGATTSQLPEFSQQYRQRLGGAVAELSKVVQMFDNDAQHYHLTREQALQKFSESNDDFMQQRHQSLTLTFNRFNALTTQQKNFVHLKEFVRPAALFSTYDEELLKGTWQDYQPAIPMSSQGLTWAGIGVLGSYMAMNLLQLLIFRKKRKKIPYSTSKISSKPSKHNKSLKF